VVPLIEVYTRDGRGWNSTKRRVSAQNQLLQAANQAKDIDSLREWILSQRYSGVLVETWFAFRCFEYQPGMALPDEELGMAKMVIEAYVRHFQNLGAKVNADGSGPAEATT
jgi:hypothetical protein